jgi:IS5 family transposase
VQRGVAGHSGRSEAAAHDEAQAVVRRITGELAGLAERAAADAEQLLLNRRPSPSRLATRPGEGR